MPPAMPHIIIDKSVSFHRTHVILSSYLLVQAMMNKRAVRAKTIPHIAAITVLAVAVSRSNGRFI